MPEIGLYLSVVNSLLPDDEFYRMHPELYKSQSHMCCYLNKVQPLQRFLEGRSAWVSDIRRDQTRLREFSSTVSIDNGRFKICPMLNWTAPV